MTGALLPTSNPLPPCVAIAGPTACGKTAAALAVAAQCDVEIISVDSALVYRGMDIGTAKPSAAELAQVPHHLINIRDPLAAYSAAEFVADAQKLIVAISARGKLPLLVGGTMLYFKALIDGLDDLPRANAAVRAAIEHEAKQLGWPAMHAALAQVDPATAARLQPADSQRISRALEVFRLTGKPMSGFYTLKTAAGKRPAGQTFTLVSLEPVSRAWLHERIARRFDAMLASGFVEEVKTLRARGDLHADLPAMRCVGYRQAWEMLEGTLPAFEWRDRGVFATRQLAKRQITWLRSMPERQVVVAEAPDAALQVLNIVRAQIAKMGHTADGGGGVQI